MTRTDISFKTGDGVTLRGWFFIASSTSTSTKLPCVILTHGLSCVKEMGLDSVAEMFISELPVTCLVYDHRGFGASATAPHAPRQEVITWQQVNDMRDAITYVQTREEVDKSKIALWGYSLSAAEALLVAAIDRRVRAVIALGPGCSPLEIVSRLTAPHALNAIRPLFEVDRLARAAGLDPIMVPMIAEPGGQCVLPSPESFAFFSEWEKNGSSWKNEVTMRSLDELATTALCAPYLDVLTPTPVFFGVATRDTNTPPDMVMRWYGQVSEPKEYAIVDADHYQLMGESREVLDVREVAFLKKGLC
ncbi:Alpha/Beta hydrolase protein [Exophiala viscosa]|uniref:Alpha/Beta hydrolase protein n=1 Tax=Exophiala viscosa TaxID=2486360 RepID=UPI00218E3282|nr:Alpha/Beta hydrolase protein [Exophiala viscosa]